MKKTAAVILTLILVVCAAVSCGSKGGAGKTASSIVPKEAQDVVRKFSEGVMTGDGDGMMLCMYPQDIFDALKASGLMNDFYNALGTGSGGELKKCELSDEAKISADACRGAQNYFNGYAQMLEVKGVSYKVSDGYSAKMNITTSENGKEDGYSEDIVIVMVDGHGWMIIPMTAQDLESAAAGADAQG
ncbi:hypothetical protein [uncultured Ruminococcus sp.]|uniref:hypothetical protein n=1 Tax=uncultured Ruminococcus sp. TaxID=165186 RepID=UPI00261AF03B|nr:hypothetical protein [uncultured Ruminococcus sp.]